MELAELRDWVGREELHREVVALSPAQRLLALLDRSPEALADGDPLPHGFHWLYCNPIVRRSQLAEDGHLRRGDFMPPIDLPRRMWAGGSLRFLQPLRIGETAERHSTILSVDEKDGRSGRLVIVGIGHRTSGPRGIAVDEEQILVYRPAIGAASQPAPTAGIDGADWSETFTADEVTLFNFSALTANGHRIHYDQPFATTREGYPALLVHAPLTALLLLDAAQRNTAIVPEDFTYRATHPLFCVEPITIAGRRAADGSVSVSAANANGQIAMQGTFG